MAVWWFFLKPATQGDDWAPLSLTFGLCGEEGSGRACVIDGDTLHISRGDEVRRIRITGYDAPELDGACKAERAKAMEAKRALHAWLADGPHEWDGGTSPPTDQYGRELRALRRAVVRHDDDANADDKNEYKNLADYMLKRGLAAESGWGAAPKDWCDS